MIDINDLEAKAKEATPGPWRSCDWGILTEAKDAEDLVTGGFVVHEETGIEKDADSLFIAAANPSAVLELIGMVRAARAEAEKWRNEYEGHGGTLQLDPTIDEDHDCFSWETRKDWRLRCEE